MVEYKETKSEQINQATYDLQHLNITGNVIPHNWFNHLKMETGAPDYQSIILLSEIVYWYKPKEVFNEQGIQVGIGKKYDADTLQKSYEDLADKFGMTKRQVREAIIRLENRGLIKRNLEYIKSKGMPVSNVLFIDLFVDKLKEITIVSESVTGVCSNSSEGYPQSRQTYTKITTKTTTKSKDIKDNVAKARKPSKVKYEESNVYFQTANVFKQLLIKNGIKVEDCNMQTWSDNIRKLVELRKQDLGTVKDMIVFVTNNEFWKGVCLSPSNLLKNYVTIHAQMLKGQNNKKKYQAPQQQAPSKQFDYTGEKSW